MKRTAYSIQPAPAEAAPLWRSLDEKVRTQEAQEAPEAYAKAQELKETEFPSGWVDVSSLSRRKFLTLSGATGAAAALSGCIRRPEEKILPYAHAPEYLVPGVPLHYATTMDRGGEALGVLVEAHEGRPTKIEGNPQHSSSLGGTDMMVQASVLDLYDAERSRGPAQRKDKALSQATWTEAEAALQKELKARRAEQGQGLAILTQPSLSPTVLRLRQKILASYPNAKFYSYAPMDDSNIRQGSQAAFGKPLIPLYDFSRARVILALDADFLGSETGHVSNAYQFANGRRLRSAYDTMSRLYVVEPSLTLTGSNADHRLRLPARDVAGYLQALAKELVSKHGVDLGAALNEEVKKAKASHIPAKWISAVAADLIAARGALALRGGSLVLAGRGQPAHVHALAHALNVALANRGQTVRYAAPLDAEAHRGSQDLLALAQEARAGHVRTLLILGGNPVYDAPQDAAFQAALAKVPFTLHLSSHRDETSSQVQWHWPRAHELESWGDFRANNGTVSIQQPLIAPLFGGRSDIEFLGRLASEKDARGYALVRQTWSSQKIGVESFEQTWRASLHRGYLNWQEVEAQDAVTLDAVAALWAQAKPAVTPLSRDNLEVTFAPDNKLYDGRYAGNAWLLELPDPITRISWDNAALISPATALELGLSNGDVVTLSGADKRSIRIAVWVLPGQADHSIRLSVGWGRGIKVMGGTANKNGFDVYPLRSSQGSYFQEGIRLQKENQKHTFVQTQEQHSMEGRPIAIDSTLEQYKKTPDFAQYRSPTPSTQPLWKQVEYKDHKWGMSVDLNACIGCNACSIACQSENNIPVVGKEQIAKGREMHWLRIDRYFLGENAEEPEVAFQPVACVHCEEAPCENVCPVNATEHSPEGLNDMAYNRCIGTRYCANNCPYKVRRFNYLDFHGDVPETKKMQFNPNVTVRMRGVMEKCTYCVQRIEAVRIDTKRDGRTIQDGDIRTACQQACPTQAIVFGDLNDSHSQVAALSTMDRGYKLLAEIGTQPRTTYLAKIRNPNPEMLS